MKPLYEASCGRFLCQITFISIIVHHFRKEDIRNIDSY